MRYTKHSNMTMLRGSIRAFFSIIVSTAFLVLTLPQMAFAQSYVPVIDIQLNPFMQNALGAATPNGTTDSLRDLISGSNPSVAALGGRCQGGNNFAPGIVAPDGSGDGLDNPAFPYPDGPWMSAINSPAKLTNGVPTGATSNGPYVQINTSQSLRCLLVEVVEWQKLGLSVQIHSLLKTYISDAQQAQLTKQLKNRVTAANLEFAKAGNQVSNAGVQSTAPVFVTNYNQNIRNVNGRQLDAISDQAAADPASGNPQGSLGICQPWRIDTAASVVKNNRIKVEDPFSYTDQATGCSLTTGGVGQVFANETDFANFTNNFEDPSSINGSLFTFEHMLSNPQDTPLGAAMLVDQAASGRIGSQEQSTKAEAANSGFLPTKVCSGNPEDPHCLDDQNSQAVNPGGQNESNITNLTTQMNNEITSASIDSQTATSSQRAPTDINTNTGLAGADTLPLETSTTAINELIREFYDTIQYGYFGIHQNTTEWAQGTMLMIYDEMKFSQDLLVNSASVVTNGQAPAYTNY